MAEWIECGRDNPPPGEIPDDSIMAVWTENDKNWQDAAPVWVYEDWRDVGDPGVDFFAYMVVKKFVFPGS